MCPSQSRSSRAKWESWWNKNIFITINLPPGVFSHSATTEFHFITTQSGMATTVVGWIFNALLFLFFPHRWKASRNATSEQKSNGCEQCRSHQSTTNELLCHRWMDGSPSADLDLLLVLPVDPAMAPDDALPLPLFLLWVRPAPATANGCNDDGLQSPS